MKVDLLFCHPKCVFMEKEEVILRMRERKRWKRHKQIYIYLFCLMQWVIMWSFDRDLTTIPVYKSAVKQ